MTGPGGRDAGRGKSRNLLRWLSAGVLLVGLASYLGDLRPDPLHLPLAALEPSGREVPSLPAAPGALRGYDVVLVTLDTTRPDRLGFYGNDRIETPNLDRLAAGGVVFSNALATAPTTLPAHASILTGLYPHRHGARTNSLYVLASEQRTLAEILAEHGYETAAFVSSFVLDAESGLGQGFESYDDRAEASATVAGYEERRGDRTTDAALRWLGAHRTRPYFLWVHYYDPHVAYDPPEGFGERGENAYDAEIAFVDAQLGRLLAAVGSTGGRGKLIVVTADHGEAFGEHGETTHGLLVQEATLRIPLLLFAPGGLEGGLHVARRTSQVDLLPTILSLLGLPVPDGLDGVDLLEPPPADRGVLAESVLGRAHYGWAPLAALYHGRWKVVEGPRPELYDLELDPLEREDLAAVRRAETDQLLRRLRGTRGTEANEFPSPDVELDAEDRDRLQALGYVVGEASGRVVPGGGPDPRHMVPVMSALLELLSEFDTYQKLGFWERIVYRVSGRPLLASRDDLIRELEAFAAEHPGFPPVYAYLSGFYRQEQRLAESGEASRRFEAAVRAAAGGG